MWWAESQRIWDRICEFGSRAHRAEVVEGSLSRKVEDWGLWVSRENRLGSFIRAVCWNLHICLQNPAEKSCEGMHVAVPWLRQKPFTLFILLGWCSVLSASVMTQFMMEKMLVLWWLNQDDTAVCHIWLPGYPLVPKNYWYDWNIVKVRVKIVIHFITIIVYIFYMAGFCYI
jgi:hypothetical protein